MAMIKAGAGAETGAFNTIDQMNVKRSKFDLSRITNFTCDSGMIIPFDYFPTLPGDSFKLESEINLETLPTITNQLTPYHVRTHWYYIRNSDLWKGWNTFITKGRTGNIEYEIPKINPRKVYQKDGFYFAQNTAHSLQSFLGAMPINIKNTNSGLIEYQKNYLPYAAGTSSNLEEYTKTNYHNVGDGINALPFMAYQSIVKYNYVNQNLLQENTALFPEDGDSDWRIPTHVENEDGYTNTVDGKYVTEITNDNVSINGIYKTNDTVVMLDQLRYAQFEQDQFTTALPWLQRGTQHTLETTIDLSDTEIELGYNDRFINVRARYGDSGYNSEYPVTLTNGTSNNQSYTYSPRTFNNNVNSTSKIGANGEGNLVISNIDLTNKITAELVSGTAQTTLTANELRELIAMSVWQERNAKVNGSYNSMIWVHFNENPHTEDHYPTFIGGTSDYIQFGEVVQTSESGDTPQGTVRSKGDMYSSQEIGKFDSPDYGYIMGILIITPITTYNTTQPHDLVCEKTQEDFYFPEFEQLSPQPILNKELYTSGSTTTDNNLFGYRERYNYLKGRENVNRGLFRLPSESDTLFSSATQAREFEGTPQLSYQFLVQSPNNTRRDWLAYPSEPMFKIQVASKVEAVRPLSYASKPNTFGF